MRQSPADADDVETEGQDGDAREEPCQGWVAGLHGISSAAPSADALLPGGAGMAAGAAVTRVGLDVHARVPADLVAVRAGASTGDADIAGEADAAARAAVPGIDGEVDALVAAHVAARRPDAL